MKARALQPAPATPKNPVAAISSSILAVFVLLGCLQDHPVREPSEFLALEEARDRLERPKGALTASLHLEDISGNRRMAWWTGSADSIASAPAWLPWGGGEHVVVARGYLGDTVPCHETRWNMDAQGTVVAKTLRLDSCDILARPDTPSVAAPTGPDSALLGVDHRYEVRVRATRSRLSRYAVSFAGTVTDSGTLAGRDTTLRLKRRFAAEGSLGAVFRAWTDAGVEGRAGWEVQVVDQPLKALAGADALVYTEHSPVLRLGRSQGGLDRIAALEWLTPQDSVLDSILPNLTWTLIKVPDTLVGILRVRDIYGRTASDTAILTAVYPARMAYAHYKPFVRGAADSAERLNTYASHPAVPTLRHEGDGTKELQFSWLEPLTLSGNLQVTPVSAEPLHCAAVQTESAALLARILCLSPSGTPVDAPFSLRVVAPMLGNASGIHSFTSTDSAHFGAGTSANPNRSFNDGSLISLKKTGTGIYTVIFQDLGIEINGPGSAMVTAIAPAGAWCKLGGWARNGADVTVHIGCHSANGKAADARFSVSVLGPLKMRTNYELAYAVGPEGPGDPEYTGPNRVVYNSTGADIAYAKAGTGRYAVTFGGMGAAYRERPGAIQVVEVGFGSNNTCQAASWTGDPDLTVEVRCFSPTGAPADSRFSISVIK